MNKVLFECEKCGHRWEPKKQERESSHRRLTVEYDELCPICHPPEPTYGPITVEMVESLLCMASCYKQDSRECRKDGVCGIQPEARAVIRLLNYLRPVLGLNLPIGRDAGPDWHAKLLDLARP